MAGPDPDRNVQERSLLHRFLRIMRIAAAFSLAIAGLAVALVAWGSKEFHVHMLIATALGAGLTVLLGTALMSLVFLSNNSGHDDAAARSQAKDSE